MAGPQLPESRELLKLWRRFRGSKRLPDQDDVRLEELADFLPNIYVLDIESDKRFIWSYCGAQYRERFHGLDFTGRNILDVPHPFFQERLVQRIRTIFDFGYAGCTHTRLMTTDGRMKTIENMAFPIEKRPGGVRQAYIALYYIDGPDATAFHNPGMNDVQIVGESFIDLGSGYAAVIDASELPHSVFPGLPDQTK